MGESVEVNAASVADVLSRLNIAHVQEYRQEFAELAGDVTLAMEDWSTEPELLEVLYSYIRCARPGLVVEIGTYKGAGAIVFQAAVAKNGIGRVVTIDNNSAGTVAQAQERFRLRGVEEKITLLEKSSNRAFSRWKRVPIDFLYIDGSHNYVQACCDFALWARRVTPEGLIAIHDTVYYLERRFPDDYIYPLAHYDILNVVSMRERPSGQIWKGCGFVRTPHQA